MANDAYTLIYFTVLALIFVSVPVGLVLIQIKGRPLWRLLSVAIAIIGYCWLVSFFTRMSQINKVGEYQRENINFVMTIDEMTLQGRTNDVHHACQSYANTIWSEDYPDDFDAMIGRVGELAFNPPQTNSEVIPKVSNSTNTIAHPQ
jgi:hypothetical protein